MTLPPDIAAALDRIDAQGLSLDDHGIDEFAVLLRSTIPVDYVSWGWTSTDGTAFRTYAVWVSPRLTRVGTTYRIFPDVTRARLVAAYSKIPFMVFQDASLGPHPDRFALIGVGSYICEAIGKPPEGVLVFGFAEKHAVRDEHLPWYDAIAERFAKAAERAVTRARAVRGDLLALSTPDAVITVDKDRNVADANPAASRLWGLPRDALVGRRIGTLLELSHGPTPSEPGVRLPGWALAGMGRIPIEVTVIPGVGDPGHAFDIHVADLRALRQAEAEQRRTADDLAVLTTIAHACAVTLDFAEAARLAAGALVEHRAVDAVLLARLDDAAVVPVAHRGKHVAELVDAVARARANLDGAATPSAAGNASVAVLPLAVDETPRGTLALRTRPGIGASDGDRMLWQACADVLAGALAGALRREALATALDRQRRLLDGLPMCVWETDVAGDLTYCNAAVEPMLGYKPDEIVRDRSLWQATSIDPSGIADFGEHVAEYLRSGRPIPWVDGRRRHRDGHVVTFSRTVHPLVDRAGQITGYIGMSLDVTAVREAQRQLFASDRLAALGRLAAGVGHELNNPAAYVALGVRQIGRLVEQARVAEDPHAVLDRMAPTLDDISDGVRRIAQITSELRQFARPPDGRSGDVDPGALLRSAATLVETELRGRATLALSVEDLPRTEGRYGALSQVFLNLMLHASHAIPEGAPAQHRIDVAARAVDDTLVVEVAQNGVGFAPDALAHAFDPFYPRSPTDTGGLGLAIAWDTVRQLGGTLTVENQPEGGARFTVRVPLGERPGEARP